MRPPSLLSPLPQSYCSSLINDRLYKSNMTVKLHLDRSAMVYSRVGSSDLFLILGCMTSNFLYLSFSTLHSSFLWRADTTIFIKLNNPPLSNSTPPPPNRFEIYKPPGVVNRGFTVDLLFLSLGAGISRSPAAVFLSKKCINDQYTFLPIRQPY